MPTLPPAREKRVVASPKAKDTAAGHLAGLCLICREPYQPEVYEDICSDCVAAIVADPDSFWSLFLTLKMFDKT